MSKRCKEILYRALKNAEIEVQEPEEYRVKKTKYELTHSNVSIRSILFKEKQTYISLNKAKHYKWVKNNCEG